MNRCAFCGAEIPEPEVVWLPANPMAMNSSEDVPVHQGDCAERWMP